MALRLLLIINCCLLQKEELLQDRILFVDSSHNFFWLLLMQSWSKCSKNWTFRSCFTSSELFLPFSFQQDTVLGRMESVTLTYSVPHIRLPASLRSGTSLRQPENSFLFGNCPLPMCNLCDVNRNENQSTVPKEDMLFNFICWSIFVSAFKCIFQHTLSWNKLQTKVFFNVELNQEYFKQQILKYIFLAGKNLFLVLCWGAFSIVNLINQST